MSSAKDEVARRTSSRRDPRVDPDSVPAMRAVKEEGDRKPKAVAREEVAPRAARRDPRAESDSVPAMRAVSGKDAPAEEVAVEVDAGGDRASAPEAKAVEERPAPSDPRLAELEPLFDRTAWKEIEGKLGPPDEAGKLSPALALVYALARREAAGDEAARGATELAIQSMAALIGVPPGSPIALVLAKRLLRQNPASWRTRPAPPAKLSVAIILIGIAIGVAAGSFLSLSAFQSIKLF
jgi:hypothetical protein